MPSSERIAYLDMAIRSVLFVYIVVLPFKALLVVERTAFLILLGLLAFWCLFNRKLFYVRTPFDPPLAVFILWVGLTIPFSVFPEYSLKEYGKLLQWVTVFYAVIHFFGEQPYRAILVSLLVLMTFVVTAYGLTQFNLSSPQRIVASFSAEVWLTTFLVMMIPFGLASSLLRDGPAVVKRAGAIVTILAGLCLLSTQSRAGLVAFLAELLAMAWVVRSRLAMVVSGGVMILLLTAILIAFMVKTSGSSVEGQNSIPVKTGIETVVHRLDIWRFTLSEIARHWLVGIGYGGQTYSLLYGGERETVAPGHTSVKATGTHNILLYLSLHVGLIGMALFAWFYFSAVRTTFREYSGAVDWISKIVLSGAVGSMVGLFVRLQFDQMFVGSLAILFWVLLATAVLHYPSYRRTAACPTSG